MKKMKQIICLIVIVVLISTVSAASGDTTVYITNTGEKYHSYGCQYLRKSCIEISLRDAVARGYTRCSKCNPPYLDDTTASTSGRSYSSGSTSSGSSYSYSSSSSSGSTSSSSSSSSKNTYSSGTSTRSTNTSNASTSGTISGPGFGSEGAELKAKVEEYEEIIADYKENYISKEAAAAATEDAVSKAVAEEQEKNQKEKSRIITTSVVISILCICVICGVQYSSCNRALRKKDEEVENGRKELQKAQNVIAQIKQFNSEREDMIHSFHGQTCRQLANVPDGVIFGNDFFPVKIGAASLVVYISKSGEKYHRYGCRYFDGATAINVYKIPKTCVPCKVCKPQLYGKVPEWVFDYQKFISIKKKYNISDPDLPYPQDRGVDS